MTGLKKKVITLFFYDFKGQLGSVVLYFGDVSVRLLVLKSTGQQNKRTFLCLVGRCVGFCRRACDSVKRPLHSLVYCHCYIHNHAWKCFFFLSFYFFIRTSRL